MPLFAFFFWDPTILLLVPAMILALWAQARVRGAYSRFIRVPSRRGLSGREVAEGILAGRGLGAIPVEATRGQLDDHYDPRRRSVHLSPAVYQGSSLAALAIAAHETGHAMQHADGWAPLSLRSAIAPAVGIGSSLAFPLFLVGFIFSSVRVLMDVGILLFGLAVLFHLVTLPVEFDASRRALSILRSDGYLQQDEHAGAKKVLNAAAWTYVAAATVAVMHLIRLLVLRGARD